MNKNAVKAISVLALLAVLTVIIFAFACADRKSVPLERFVYITNTVPAAPLIIYVTNTIPQVVTNTVHTEPIIVFVTNTVPVIVTNTIPIMVTNTIVIHTNTVSTHTNTVIVYTNAPQAKVTHTPTNSVTSQTQTIPSSKSVQPLQFGNSAGLSSNRKFFPAEVRIEPLPPIEPETNTLAVAATAVKSESVPALPTASPHKTTTATVKMADGTWINPAQLPPPITVDKVTFSTSLTDYTVKHGQWFGVHESKQRTKLYYPQDIAEPNVILADKKTLLVSFLDPSLGTSTRFLVPLQNETKASKIRAVPADKDPFKFGVAFLREETKNGSINPPMTLALHPELRSPETPAMNAPTAPRKEVRKVALSPRAASQKHTLMRR